MDFWYALIGIIAFIVGFPYIRCFFKRLNCACKIKMLCRKKGYKAYATHPLWFLGNKYGKKCDLYIKTANKVFAIKLFGMPRRLSILILKESGEYVIRSYIALISYCGSIRCPIDSKPKPMPAYDFRYRYKDEWEIKTPRRVLLVNPAPMEIKFQSHHGSEVIVGSGDIANGMVIDSLPRLLRDLENAL